jgi:hypothetical protein
MADKKFPDYKAAKGAAVAFLSSRGLIVTAGSLRRVAGPPRRRVHRPAAVCHLTFFGVRPGAPCGRASHACALLVAAEKCKDFIQNYMPSVGVGARQLKYRQMMASLLRSWLGCASGACRECSVMRRQLRPSSLMRVLLWVVQERVADRTLKLFVIELDDILDVSDGCLVILAVCHARPATRARARVCIVYVVL